MPSNIQSPEEVKMSTIERTLNLFKIKRKRDATDNPVYECDENDKCQCPGEPLTSIKFFDFEGDRSDESVVKVTCWDCKKHIKYKRVKEV